jgi:hypothetical protein
MTTHNVSQNKIELYFNTCKRKDDVNEADMATEIKLTPPDQTFSYSTILAHAKEGQCFNLDQSGKVFTKVAGMIAAPDMEAYESIRPNVSAEFFNTRVVRIAYARAYATTSKRQ